MKPQRVIADDRVKADLGSVALKYGPLVYNVERADHQNIDQPISDAPLKTEWRPDLLGGVMVLTGSWKDGSPMVAIPNYARMNRVGRPSEYPGEPDVDFAPGATASAGSSTPETPDPVTVTPTARAGNTLPVNGRRMKRGPRIESKVWI